MRPLHPDEVELRKAGWQRLWRERFVDDVGLLPANVQGVVHDLMKAAFKAGTTWERRRHEPMQVGGID